MGLAIPLLIVQPPLELPQILWCFDWWCEQYCVCPFETVSCISCLLVNWCQYWWSGVVAQSSSSERLHLSLFLIVILLYYHLLHITQTHEHMTHHTHIKYSAWMLAFGSYQSLVVGRLSPGEALVRPGEALVRVEPLLGA